MHYILRMIVIYMYGRECDRCSDLSYQSISTKPDLIGNVTWGSTFLVAISSPISVLELGKSKNFKCFFECFFNRKTSQEEVLFCLPSEC